MYSIIDIETTGGHRDGNKITEIAIINFDGEKIEDTFTTLINPERQIPWTITRLTGITNEMVSAAPKFYDIAKKIVEMTEGRIFVAHNVFFDFNFLKREFSDLGYSFRRKKACTVRLARKHLPGYHSYSLGKICSDLGIHIEGRHRAFGDASATVELLKLILAVEKNAIDKNIVEEGGNITFPSGLNLEDYHSLPEKAGVYYFYSAENELLYVGKSNSIKKRVQSHFRPNIKRKKDLQLKSLISRIEHRVTGSELSALLLECHEIKTHRPRFNRSLNRKRFPYVVYPKFENGVIKLHLGRESISDGLYRKFSSRNSATNAINHTYRTVLGVDQDSLHFMQKKDLHIKTLGPENFNEQVEKFFFRNLLSDQNFCICLNGRTRDESCYVLVEDGCPKLLRFMTEADEEQIKLKSDEDMKNLFFNYIDKYNLKKLQIKKF